MTSLEPHLRLQALDSTGLPRGFVLELSFRVNDARGCEAAVHNALAVYRDTSEREFFRLEPRMALELCSAVIGQFIFHSEVPNSPVSCSTPELPENTARIMAFVSEQNDWNRKAYTHDVAGCFDISENEAILILGDLKEMKFVKSFSESKGVDYWVPMHKGLRYLKEHPTQWMREE